jgi:hypothetical protein
LIDERAELLALVDKYERMTALRATLGRGAPSTEDRERLRALARDFPGALRELDTIDDAELARRRAASREAEPAAWLRWMAAYHTLMRRALALRRGDRSELDSTHGDSIEGREATVSGDVALPRRNGSAQRELGIDDEFADAIRSPRHGRMNVVVFEALARRFALPVATLWDALFPQRGARGVRSYRT